jgi:carbon-monoxide dehydrogenase large subunit
VIAAVVARELGRPVKWTESRGGNFQATHHGRGRVQDIEIAEPDGQILGLKVDLLADMGAYPMIITPGTPLLARSCTTASTRWTRTSSPARACSPTSPTDAYRGARAGRGLRDQRIVATAESSIEPMELRRRN